MATPSFLDPLQMWRDAVNKLEKEVNTLAAGSTQSEQVVRSLHGFSSASLALQQVVDKSISAYLRKANLPSRKEVADLAETLQRIEGKLDRLLPPDPAAEAPARPARTRRPPASAAVAPPEPPAAKPAAKRPARRRAPARD
ncbi:MAG: hypothetical protein QM788_07030 [Roseateles sp.]|uniref:hypothetical protein n=1 Tax=Roseateles sp. TaxID=1971397 RepID=UPI0039ED4176